MHKSRLAALVIDSPVEDIDKATEFWSKALGYSSDQADEEWAGNYAQLNTADDEPHILIQKVDHPSRVHLDIETDNIKAEVSRLEKLGATIVNEMPRWTVMEAPTGHRYCVVNPQRADFEQAENVNTWE